MIQEYWENYYEDIYIQKFYYLQIFSNIDEQVVWAIITSRWDELDIILPSFPTRWSFGNMWKLNKTTFIEIRSNPMHLVDTYINSAHHFFVYAETYMADAIVLPWFHLLFWVNELWSNVKYISTDQNIWIWDYDDDFWLLTWEDLRNSLVLNEFYEHDSPNYYWFFLWSPLMITWIDKIDIKYTPGYQ
jgi:hypothetical protein